jgi:predicted nucleotidyltransferase
MHKETFSFIAEHMFNNNILNDLPVHGKNIHYEVIVGSTAYGVSNDSSDIDIYAVSIPRKDVIFPKHIPGFGKPPVFFNSYQKHGVVIVNAEYDVSIYGIVKYFQLCMDCNPNMIDSLFVPDDCITYMSDIGEKIRDNRHLFLSKKCYHTFKGYAKKQLHMIRTKQPVGKRLNTIKEYGFDVKFAYHIVRLLLQAEEILSEGNLTLNRNKEVLSNVRDGKWPIQEIEEYFMKKLEDIENLYIKSTLPDYPREREIESLLISCLEDTFGKW